MCRHGLRLCEVVSLRWGRVDLKAGLPHGFRPKNGVPSTHPLRGPELPQLFKLRRLPKAPVNLRARRSDDGE
jgi:type 1 fimbriae regulatory protein FimB/type 1 fimbriae regulatory protein FimE